MKKTWNPRDEPTDELRRRAEKLYQEIANNYKLLKKLANIEDAKKMVESIWAKKSMANDIELEIIRREYNGTPQ